MPFFHRLELVYRADPQTQVEPEQKPRPQKQQFHTGAYEGIGHDARDRSDGDKTMHPETLQTGSVTVLR